MAGRWMSLVAAATLAGCAAATPSAPKAGTGAMQTRAAAESLAPSGTLRAAINLGNPVLAQMDEASGALGGVSVDLARELARRLGRPVELLTYPAAGQVFADLDRDAWDVAFLAVEPARAERIAFSAPYVEIEGTYLVRDEAPFRSVADLDRPGVRIAAGLNAAYDLFLSRTLRSAELVRAPTSAAAVELFLAEGLEAAAGVRQPLTQAAAERPGLRVLGDSFQTIRQAAAIPRTRAPEASHFLHAFVEEMKASGFVRRALDASGQVEAVTAPPAAAPPP